MLTAEEARAELKKKKIDRLPENEQEEIKLILDYFAQELEDSIAEKINLAILREDYHVEYKVSHVNEFYRSSVNRFETIYPDTDFCITSVPYVYEKFGGTQDKYVWDEFEKVVLEQAESLRSLGYEVDITIKDGKQLYTIIERNSINLTISWAEESDVEDESDAISEEQQTQVRRVEYELESKRLPIALDEYQQVNAKSQDELKDLPKKKKRWWQI